MRCFFVSDLHGTVEKYQKLFDRICSEPPGAVFLGGDLLPNLSISPTSEGNGWREFVRGVIIKGFLKLKESLKSDYPQVFVIMGNDDPRILEKDILEGQAAGAWEYVNNRLVQWGPYPVYGYSFVPPTPFLLKDWERFDVSRYVDPGCISPEEGWRSVNLPASFHPFATIQEDLDNLAGNDDMSRAIFLMHSPPYQTCLDRADLEDRWTNGVPMDVNVGSIAIRRFIEQHQPWITLHGHIHEAARLSGAWHDRIGKTHLFGAAHDGPELALVSFDPKYPERVVRELV
jgi:uncharacterized protein